MPWVAAQRSPTTRTFKWPLFLKRSLRQLTEFDEVSRNVFRRPKPFLGRRNRSSVILLVLMSPGKQCLKLLSQKPCQPRKSTRPGKGCSGKETWFNLIVERELFTPKLCFPKFKGLELAIAAPWSNAVANNRFHRISHPSIEITTEYAGARQPTPSQNFTPSDAIETSV